MKKSPYPYTVFMPEKIEEGKKYPVIYALHGIGLNEEFMVNMIKELKDEAIIIGIRGDLPHKKGYAYYYLKDYGKPERELFFASIEKLRQFFSYCEAHYPLDTNKKYLIGFSQGAILSICLALVLGDEIAGIVPMNGYVPDFLREVYPLKNIDHLDVFLCHGANDKIFPLEVGHETYTYFLERAQSVKYSIYPTAHEISANNKEDVRSWLWEQIQNSENSVASY